MVGYIRGSLVVLEWMLQGVTVDTAGCHNNNTFMQTGNYIN